MNKSTSEFPETKFCNKCGVKKPITEFYSRSGFPGRHLSTCKECHKVYMRDHQPGKTVRLDTEQMVVDECLWRGVYAELGRETRWNQVDVVAWGCVRLEVKYSSLRRNGCFTFSIGAKKGLQSERADLMVLICGWSEAIHTYHLFNSSEAIFYRYENGERADKNKTDFRVIGKPYKGRLRLTPEIMEAHQNRWDLIEQARAKIIEDLLR